MKKRDVPLEIVLLRRYERRCWNGINPVTRVIPSGKRYRRKSRSNRQG